MDVVVMCRHGTFYNMFDVDSDVGIDVGLNISGKACAFMQKVGCHHEVFDAWARKVLARGWAVAVRLLPVRPRSRGARRSLRTFPVVTLHPRFPFNV
jgi:hypothetical protein